MVSALKDTAAPSTSPGPEITPFEPALIQAERQVLRDVLRLVAERATAEAETAKGRATRDAKTDQEYQDARRAILERYETQKATALREDDERRRSITQTATTSEAEAKAEFSRASRRLASEFDRLREQSHNDFQHARWELSTVFETGEKGAQGKYAAAKARLDDAGAYFRELQDRSGRLFESYRGFGLDEPSSTPTVRGARLDDPIGKLHDRLVKAEEQLVWLEGLLIPKALRGGRDLSLFLLAFLAALYPLAIVLGWVYGTIAALGLAVVVGFVLRRWLVAIAKRQVREAYLPLHQQLVDAEALATQSQAFIDEELRTRRAELTRRRIEDLARAKLKQDQTIHEGEARRDEELRRVNEIFSSRMGAIQVRRDDELRFAREVHDRRWTEIQARHDDDLRRLDEQYYQRKESHRSRYENAWRDLTRRWTEGMTRAHATLSGVRAEVDRISPPWRLLAAGDRLPTVVPPVVRFGEVRLDLAHLPGGISTDRTLMQGVPTEFVFPALLPFPQRPNLLIEARGEGAEATAAALQGTMMRLLTSLPPGKVRFTLVDPVGLGRNFGAFMHLADFDEALVTGRVWTEPQQIEQRLSDLSAHMEKVIQKYLRNEYATLEDYNATAGEVAEPFRVLVIADFPAGFDESAARRLSRIATSGVRCGVLTLIAVDRDKPLPPGIDLDDLRAQAVNLYWDGNRLAWRDEDFGNFPLVVDASPRAEEATAIVHAIGSAAKHASRVEVPFEYIAPPPDRWWTGDSRAGIDIDLGKVGATKKQALRLGRGTSQHVLIAGRTGSGKSTLLHALITNLALNYSPDEVELYLIDFKKGVEFKTYATHELPHARVIAIESEREFGVSVLQRLDAELRGRAEKFREAGVQDLNGYRNADGTPPLPRVLLIVDEFQEFFVEDDKIAQEASLLLDRLVRQGRAFGVHVHLGSQSLSGAYSLARSTLGQMAVRIALQCSEVDAHLILSEDNAAARLLSRPGEAVYNDANGLVEGNHFFQVVWLPDERRETYLKRIHDLARKRRPQLTRPPIVFEGNLPAVLAKNPLLQQRLAATTWPVTVRAAHAWLGEAIAIKDPTSVLFRRQGANHLLIVGQNDEAALGIMVSSLLSLAAQFAPAESDETRSGARFTVLDGTPEDSPLAGLLARAAGVVPHPTTIGGWRDAARLVAELAEEVERRGQPEAPDGSERFLFVHDLQRFRDLRKRDDDFSFSRRDEGSSPADQFAAILRDGPGVGVHVLTWCDSLNNLNRTLDRAMLREFETRVLFQMSPTDSSHLIDSPLASKLGPHRAFLSSEEQGQLEKFRPYGPPDVDWLAWVRDQLRKRAAAVEGEVGATLD